MPVESVEAFAHAGIGERVIEHVRFVIIEKKDDAFFHFFFRSTGAESAFDEQENAAANVAGDLLLAESCASKVFERGVHGKNEVELGIDEGPVEIEDERFYAAETFAVCGHRNPN